MEIFFYPHGFGHLFFLDHSILEGQHKNLELQEEQVCKLKYILFC